MWFFRTNQLNHLKIRAGDKAIFSSPWLITKDWYDYNCNLTFWYHMKGAHIGQLDLRETSTGYWNKGDKVIWTRNSSVVRALSCRDF